MKKSSLRAKKEELRKYIDTLTAEQLPRVIIIMEFVLSATSDEKYFLEKMMESDDFDPDQMIEFMKIKIAYKKQPLVKEVV